MYLDGKLVIGKAGDKDICITPSVINRHGMIAGATGTGKTTTLRVFAEALSEAGIPVFMADVKGDLAGMCAKGENSYPVNLWDVYGKGGLPLRTTVSDMGPVLLAHALSLNDTQTDILRVIFKIADDEGLLLLDSKDLREMLTYVGNNAKDFSLTYGNMSKQSISAIIRSLIALEDEGADQFFGEPALDVNDWISTMDGKGCIQMLDCRQLISNPKMYASFMLWMISELYETMPEVGDLDKPKMVFFFDEAHLLFDHAPKALLDKIIQVVKLIRSKGIGLYFISQSPQDIPDEILAQLGNKLQHALHAYTPAETKKAKAAADSYRSNPEFDTYETMTSLGIGEALVSVLDENGVPGIVEKCKINMPLSQGGAIDDESRQAYIKRSNLYGVYHETIDRESAYECLKERAERALVEAEESKPDRAEKKQESATEKAAKKAAKSVASTTAGTIGREIGKSVGSGIGGTFGKRLGGNIGASIGRGLLSTLFK